MLPVLASPTCWSVVPVVVVLMTSVSWVAVSAQESC